MPGEWIGGERAHRANVGRRADTGVRGRMEVLVLAEAKVCDLEDRCGALARPGHLELDESVLQLEISMREALLVDELHSCTGAPDGGDGLSSSSGGKDAGCRAPDDRQTARCSSSGLRW